LRINIATIIQPAWQDFNKWNRPLTTLTPNKRAVVCHANRIAVAIYVKHARGALFTAKSQSPSAIAQNERVKPQNGHGYPVRLRKVHFFKGRKSHETRYGSNKAIPVMRARGR